MDEGRRQELLKELDRSPSTRGATQFRRYLNGENLTRMQAMLAKCCECMAYYVDGRISCVLPTCPLYPYMPYASNRQAAKPQNSTFEDLKTESK